MDHDVRLATEEDFPRLKALAKWLDDEHLESGEPSVLDKVVGGMAHMLREGQPLVVASDLKGDLIGFCAWAQLPNNLDGELSGLGTYVRPSHRGKRVSAYMRAVATAQWWARGARSVMGMVTAGNHAGLESVLKLGFRTIGWVVRMDLEKNDERLRQGIEGRQGRQGRQELRVEELLKLEVEL